MTTVAFTIEQRPGGLLEVQAAADVTRGTELEKRLAGCLNAAVAASMEEALEHYQTGVTITKEAIATKAREACREALRG